MDKNRRTVMKTGVLGLAAGGALAAAAAQSRELATGKQRPGGDARLNRMEADLARLQAAQLVSNIISRYELYLGLGYLTEAVEMFALKTPDVKADVGWGVYEGPASIRRLYLGLHKRMIGDRNDPASIKPGAMYVLTNTTSVVEVAADGKTAKGLWICPGFSTPVNAEKHEAKAIWGYAKRGVDFILEEGQWKIWHYQVFGVFYTPFDQAWTSTDNAGNLNFSWIPEELKPDRPTTTTRDTMYSLLKPVPANPKPPIPYRTFSETFSYM